MKRLVLWIIAAVLVIAGVAYEVFFSHPTTATDTPPSVLVNVIKLTPGSLPAKLTAYGSILAGPDAETTISLPAGGLVAAIAVLPGQRVSAGQNLATIVADPQSAADYRKAKTAMKVARINRAHTAALLKAHLATNADLANAEQAMADAAGQVAALRATGAGTTRSIAAPFAGVISAVLAAPGAAMTGGASLMRIINTQALVALVGAPPDQARRVQLGDAASISLLDSGDKLSGRVVQLANMQDPQTGLINVTLSLDAPVRAGPNEPAEAAITTGVLDGYVVPRDAIETDDQGNYAFQVDEKNIAHRVAVHVLGNQGDQTVIARDLNPAMPLVTTGAYQLDDGVAVRMAVAGGAMN